MSAQPNPHQATMRCPSHLRTERRPAQATREVGRRYRFLGDRPKTFTSTYIPAWQREPEPKLNAQYVGQTVLLTSVAPHGSYRYTIQFSDGTFGLANAESLQEVRTHVANTSPSAPRARRGKQQPVNGGQGSGTAPGAFPSEVR